MQCIRRYFDTGKRHPNLPNAFKYALAMMVTIFSVFNPNVKKHTQGDGWQAYQGAWTTAYIVSTLYTYSWDVFMDWSLGDKGYYFLRERRMFRHRTYYYCAIVADLLLRFLWTYTLIPEKDQDSFSNGVSLSSAVAPFAAAAEICRRTMWSFFRLENEHLNNTSGYRRVAHIPLHFDTPLKPNDLNKNQNKNRWTVIFEIVAIVVIVIAVSCVAVLVKN
jgi:xenotropic and polytropic retrovirus receptor 1